jgi:hypothetical protein
MDIEQLLEIIDNLPPSVLTTSGPNLNNIVGAIVLTSGSYTTGWETYTQNMSLSPSSGAFLDTIGAFFGIPRSSIETDAFYAAKLRSALSSKFGSPDGIINFLQQVYGVSVLYQETASPPSYTLVFPTFPNEAFLNTVLENLKYVRPAGVPFFIAIPTSVPSVGLNLYLGTNLNTLTTAFASNSFLGSGTVNAPFSIPANTSAVLFNSQYPYFTDPILTGTVAP